MRKNLKRFLECWRLKQYKPMMKFLQKTWTSTQKNGFLSKWLGIRRLLSYNILKTNKESDCMYSVVVWIKSDIMLNSRRVKTIKELVFFNIIKETAPYSPSINGEWGVNPVLRYKEII